MRLAVRFAASAALSVCVFADAALAQTAIATMPEAQLKSLLVGAWTIDAGYGASTITISDLQNGQLRVRGPVKLDYDAMFVRGGQIAAGKITLDANSASLQGSLTSPTHMEGTLSFRGDTTGSSAHWHADRAAR